MVVSESLIIFFSLTHFTEGGKRSQQKWPLHHRAASRPRICLQKNWQIADRKLLHIRNLFFPKLFKKNEREPQLR